MQGKIRGRVPGWACIAQLPLIEQSAHQLVTLADKRGWKSVCIVRPGCGAGELNYTKDVEPILSSILDDRFDVITF
jgi:hypothetical protein